MTSCWPSGLVVSNGILIRVPRSHKGAFFALIGETTPWAVLCARQVWFAVIEAKEGKALFFSRPGRGEKARGARFFLYFRSKQQN